MSTVGGELASSVFSFSLSPFTDLLCVALVTERNRNRTLVTVLVVATNIERNIGPHGVQMYAAPSSRSHVYCLTFITTSFCPLKVNCTTSLPRQSVWSESDTRRLPSVLLHNC